MERKRKTREELIEDCKILGIPVDEADNEDIIELLIETARIDEKYKNHFSEDGEVKKDNK